MRFEAQIQVAATHRVVFTRAALEPDNDLLADCIGAVAGRPARLLVFVDQGVLAAWPGLADDLAAYVGQRRGLLELTAALHTVPGTEACKNDRHVLDAVLQAIYEAGLCRRSFVIVIGGGAVLDVVGFAAATAHRGVRLIRLPTTTLSQGDSGIGVKNGINLYGRKNYLGTFDVPGAVINDERFLTTLSQRDWRCGFSEAVKVALIKDGAFFERIARDAGRIAARDLARALPVIMQSCRLHFEHIVHCGDPFERATARPLDFGHWAAHKLEEMTSFALRHGEAVALGLALDVVYCARTGLMPWSDVRAVHDCLDALGFELYHPAMADAAALFEGIEEFREHLGGELSIPLLHGIGRPTVAHDMDRSAIAAAVEELADRNARYVD